jgi:GTP-binding protein
MKFIDRADIKIKAGDGGPGLSHFRREKYVSAGGPDGGNGGQGGHVYFQATEGLNTLLDFRYQRFYKAKSGGKGGTNHRQGKRGENLVLSVPCGTVFYDVETGVCLGELLLSGQQLLIAKGGQGGIGNAVFVTSRNQAPTKTILPSCGEKFSLRLELKMIADVGIIGSPNAGKSTLVKVISAAKPQVADYPFTTLVPVLGVVSHKDTNPFVVADVPGLIPGASQGKGLGYDFLRHIERTSLLIHLIDGSQDCAEKMISDYDGILRELFLYNKSLLDRPRLTVLSKADFLVQENFESEKTLTPLNEFKNYLKLKNISYLEVSSAFHIGISELLDKVTELLDQNKNLEKN